MSVRWQPYLSIARDVVDGARRLLDTGDSRELDVRTKSNAFDLVTEWDTRIEGYIREQLHHRTPEIPILGEEEGESGEQQGELRWLVDPIDGTVNFAHGIPFFSITVALEHRGQPVVGVVRAPRLGWEFHASLGGGAFLGDDKLAVSAVDSLERAALATGFPYDRATTRHNFAEWEHMQVVASACRRFGAASLDLCMVAAGWLDGYWESRLSPWDLAAGALLVREAGGRVTSLEGGTFSSASGEALATNGTLHDTMITELLHSRSA